MPRAAFVLAVAAATVACAVADIPPMTSDGFYKGRATFFGAPKEFADAFSMRGEGSFGDFLFGSCGYFNKPRSKQKIDYDDLSLPLDGVAALADVNPDFPGSCGRCYEVRCSEGLVQANDHKPLYTGNHFYMPDRNSAVKDTAGRSFPGNPAHPQGQEYVKCWNESSVVVKIVDDCPSIQWKDGHTEPQMWCSARDIYHIDLSYWAFEKLAHPLYGVMNVDFRPVDCFTHAPLQLYPGHVSRTIYSNTPEAGWAFQTFQPAEQAIMHKDAASNGGTAACASVLPNGGVTFNCRRCTEGGYQPFNGASAISFWIKPVQNVASNGKLALKLALGWPARNQFCDSLVFLEGEWFKEQKGDHRRYEIPIDKFACGRQGLNNVEGLTFANADDGRETAFCVDHVEILPGGHYDSVPPMPALPDNGRLPGWARRAQRSAYGK